MTIKEKYCIFHIPNHIDNNGTSGSQVRPRKMMKAFEDIGYKVEVVMGYGAERKQAIERIKNNILSGVKYDFLYSESSTMPTLLTEEDHIPRYPFLDFDFFKFCKKHGIRIGLFYRDIYWRFPVYRLAVKGVKYYAAQLMYRYDLIKYSNLLDVLYLANSGVAKYLPNKKLVSISESLPPASDKNEYLKEKSVFYDTRVTSKSKSIELFYVGGLGNQYEFLELLKGIKDIPTVNLTICCREKEWNINRLRYEDYLTDRVRIVHVSGDALIPLYMQADVCCCYFSHNEYMDIAVPVKLFEYLSFGIPVLASSGNPAGEFIASCKAGWTINYNSALVKELFEHLLAHYEDIYKAHLYALKAIEGNQWADRALLVQKELT